MIVKVKTKSEIKYCLCIIERRFAEGGNVIFVRTDTGLLMVFKKGKNITKI